MKIELGQEVASAVESIVIKGTNLVPFVRPDVADVVKKVNSLSNGMLHLQSPADFFDERLLTSTLDEAARDYVHSAQLVATSSGGLTGSLGLPGMALDVPVLVASTVGMVRRHALVYGFTDIEEARGDPVPLLLALGAALGAEKAIDRLSARMGASIAGEGMEKLLARIVSQETASHIAGRWLARAVPVISSLFGAGLNYLFLREAGKRSMQHYRERRALVLRQMAAARGDIEI